MESADDIASSTSGHAEEAIVGILLRDPARLLSIPLEARWFRQYRKVIEAMQRMAGNGIEIDAVSLSDELPSVPLKTIVNWQRNDFGASVNYPHYVERLKQTFIDQSARMAIEGALANMKQGRSLSEAIGGLMAKVIDITTADGGNFTYDAKKAMSIFIDNLERTFEARERGGIGLKLGIKPVDDILGGMHPTDMIIVGARPGQGKTAMAITAIVNLARQKKRVGFFSTEMAVSQIMARMTSMVSGINAKTLRDASMNEAEYTRLTAATVHIQDLPILICDKPSITVSEITMQARAWSMSGGLDFVVVDYLTRVKPDKHTDSRNLDVGEIATGLKNLARVLNVPVMVLAQLNRGSMNRANKRPMVSDLRDSGIIEQEADQVLLLYRPGMEEGSAGNKPDEIIIDKNRHGECAIVRCQFIPHIMRWAAIDEYY
jgi:replicative DNA helicase